MGEVRVRVKNTPHSNSLPQGERELCLFNLFVLFFTYFYRITGLDAAAADYFSEDAFPRHNAVAHQPADFTFGVALLAYLRHLQDSLFAHFEDGADGQGGKVDSGGGDIFREVAGI